MFKSEKNTNYIEPQVSMNYVDIEKYWPAIQEIIQEPLVREMLDRDFGLLTASRWNLNFQSHQMPGDFDPDHGQSDRPEWAALACRGASAWLVRYYLEIAQRLLPSEDWEILSSDTHFTVWSGGWLFDPVAMLAGLSPAECFDHACSDDDVCERFFKVRAALPYSEDYFGLERLEQEELPSDLKAQVGMQDEFVLHSNFPFERTVMVSNQAHPMFFDYKFDDPIYRIPFWEERLCKCQIESFLKNLIKEFIEQHPEHRMRKLGYIVPVLDFG